MDINRHGLGHAKTWHSIQSLVVKENTVKTIEEQIAYCRGFLDALDKETFGGGAASAYVLDVLEALQARNTDQALLIVQIMERSISTPARQFSEAFTKALSA